jgi:hypothetical protein
MSPCVAMKKGIKRREEFISNNNENKNVNQDFPFMIDNDDEISSPLFFLFLDAINIIYS